MIFRPITLQEANSFLPLVKERCAKIDSLLADGQVAHQGLALERLKAGFSFAESVEGLESAPSDNKDVAELKALLKSKEAEIQTEILELRELGAIVKNIHPTRVNFWSERHKQPVYLSWQADEKEVTHWHGIHEGFSFRRAIDNKEAFGASYIN